MIGSALVRRLVSEDCGILVGMRDELDLRGRRDVGHWMAAQRPHVVHVAAAEVAAIAASRAGADIFPTACVGCRPISGGRACAHRQVSHASAQGCGEGAISCAEYGPLARRVVLPTASAALVVIATAIALSDFAAFFLVDAGAAQALAIAYLSAFAMIAATVAFADLVELLLVGAFVTKIGAAVAVAGFLNRRLHFGDASCQARADRCS
jgi:hypothetical protein